MSTLAVGVASAAAAEPPLEVEVDSVMTMSSSFTNYQYDYRAKVPIDTESGHYSGSAKGEYVKASGGGSEAVEKCGTLTETLVGTTPDTFTVTNLEGMSDPGQSPTISINVGTPMEKYKTVLSCGGTTESSRPGWYSGFLSDHVGQFSPPGVFKFPLQRESGTVIAQNTFTGSKEGTFADTTTITIYQSSPCGDAEEAGTITLSDGDAPALGSTVCVGDHLKTGADGRAEITLKDGTLMRVGPGTEVVVEQGDFKNDNGKLTMKVVLGTIWAKIQHTLGGDDVVFTNGPGNAGVRGRRFLRTPPIAGVSTTGGGSLTDDAGANGESLFHAISGKFHAFAGSKTLAFEGGHGAEVKGASIKPTDRWPPADQALVPEGEQPPKLSGLKVKAPKKGKASALFSLGAPAVVSLVVYKGAGTKAVARQSAKGRKGANSVKLKKALKPGRYTLEVAAEVDGRVAIAAKAFKIAKRGG
jgi:hypothetical protein